MGGKATAKDRLKYRRAHPERVKAQKSRYYLATRETTRWDRIFRTYGLTMSDYWGLVARQGGVCPACGRPLVGTSKDTVDHDHACCGGKTSCGRCVRGILCSRCNSALGLFHDNIATLEGAIRYLKSFAGRFHAGPPAKEEDTI